MPNKKTPTHILAAFQLVALLKAARPEIGEDYNWTVCFIPAHKRFYCSRIGVDEFEQFAYFPQQAYRQLVRWGLLIPGDKSTAYINPTGRPCAIDDLALVPTQEYKLSPALLPKGVRVGSKS
jgi:hypothetical protein